MNKLLLLFMMFVLSGCQSSAQFGRNMDSWMGKSIDSLVSQWGYPRSELTSPDGNRIYVYSNSGSYNVPPTTTYNTTSNVIGNTVYSNTYSTTDGGYSIQFSCTIYVEFDKEKTIKNVRWTGNNCVA